MGISIPAKDTECRGRALNPVVLDRSVRPYVGQLREVASGVGRSQKAGTEARRSKAMLRNTFFIWKRLRSHRRCVD